MALRGLTIGPLTPGPKPIWKLSSTTSRNRVTPDSIQDGVQHGISFTVLSPIPAVIGDSAFADGAIVDRHTTPKHCKTLLNIIKC